MTTKELIQGSYVGTQQTDNRLEKQNLKYRIRGVTPRTPSGDPSDVSVFTPFWIVIGQEGMIFEESVYFQIGDAKLASFKTALGERPEIVDATLRINNAIGTAGSVIEEVTQFLHFSRQDWVEIYPGYKVSSTEYERRFKGVDIDYFEKVMPSNLFKSFVQTMGSIEGWGIEPENIYKGKD